MFVHTRETNLKARGEPTLKYTYMYTCTHVLCTFDGEQKNDHKKTASEYHIRRFMSIFVCNNTLLLFFLQLLYFNIIA